MKKLTSICALVATVFMFLALGSTRAQASGNCEDKIFHPGSPVCYECDVVDQGGDTETNITEFQQYEGQLSFIWILDQDITLQCQCRKTFLGFETHPYEFLCTGIESSGDDDDGVAGLTGKIFWKGGPIQAEGVEVETITDADDDDDSGEGFFLKCRPTECPS
jgi:hypothetical protein